MKTKSIVCVLALIGVMAGCGGGGGVVVVVPPQAGLQTAQQILDLCTVDGVDQLLEFLALIESVLDGSAVLNVTGIDEGTMSITFDLDTSGDMVPDIIGSIALDDGTGMPPAVDFSPVVNNGLAGLPTVLAALPDNSLVLVDVNAPLAQGIVTANFSFPFVGGLPTTGTGFISVQDMDCQTELMFTDLNVLLLFTTSGIPNTAFDITVTTIDGTITGTITFDETNIAVLDVTLDQEMFQFEFDIDTGIVTVAP